jgi:hypothetical protein
VVTFDDLFSRDPQDRAKRAAAEAGREALKLLGGGLYGVGWLLAKAVLLVLLAIGGLFYGLGWVARRAVWPALAWMGAAVKLGWEDGHPNKGGDRGSS